MNIIVTGASKGIGFAIAKKFASQKEKNAIGMCSRSDGELGSAVSELRKISPKHDYFPKVCDVSQENDVNTFITEYEKKFGAIDVLVNNAGFGIFKPVLQMTKHEFESVLATNLRGAFLCTRAALPKMRERKSGTIITISSLAGKNGFPGGTAYCASKFAVRGMMQCLFLEVRTDNIRFVTVNPGSVDTEFFTGENHGSGIKSKKALMADDIAACVELAASLPQNADISDMDVRPTNPKG
jgi:3-oxoacyl-[acyl-carrier protein] reductase